MADKKVYQEEVEAFAKAAIQLQKAISPEMMMTRKMAHDWFMNHRDRLKDVVYSRDYDRELVEIISHLKDLPEKVEVIKAMVAIALSDDFYHGKEKMIIQKTLFHWNIDPSDLEST